MALVQFPPNLFEQPVMVEHPMAGLLHVFGICHCSKTRSNGFIPAEAVATFDIGCDAKDVVPVLIRAGLWVPTEGGYALDRFNQYRVPPPPKERSYARRRWESMSKRVSPVVFQRDHWTCQYCGARERLEVDHIIPIALGGTNELSNLQTLCRTCNRRKGAN